MLRGRLVTVMWIALAATLAGCGDLTGSGGRVTGQYTLRAVNGAAVPATLDPVTTIHAGSLELRRGGRFAFTIDSSVAGGGPVSSRRVATEEGNYTSSGGTISLSYEDADPNAVPVTGVVRGDTLMLTMPFGGTWVFVR